jgi:hypothetical protein
MEQKQPLQQMLLGKVDSHKLKTGTRSQSVILTNINSKWIKDLNVRLDIVKLLQGRIGKTLEHTDIGNNFLTRTPVSQQLRERIDK